MTKHNKIDNLKPFKKGQSGNPKGPPKKVITQIQEMTGRDYGVKLTKRDIYQMIQHCLEMNMTDLADVMKDQKQPAFVQCISRAILKDLKDGKIATVESIFDRVFGRPVQTNQLTGEGGGPVKVQSIKFGDKEIEF